MVASAEKRPFYIPVVHPTATVTKLAGIVHKVTDLPLRLGLTPIPLMEKESIFSLFLSKFFEKLGQIHAY